MTPKKTIIRSISSKRGTLLSQCIDRTNDNINYINDGKIFFFYGGTLSKFTFLPEIMPGINNCIYFQLLTPSCSTSLSVYQVDLIMLEFKAPYMMYISVNLVTITVASSVWPVGVCDDKAGHTTERKLKLALLYTKGKTRYF